MIICIFKRLFEKSKFNKSSNNLFIFSSCGSLIHFGTCIFFFYLLKCCKDCNEQKVLQKDLFSLCNFLVFIKCLCIMQYESCWYRNQNSRSHGVCVGALTLSKQQSLPLIQVILYLHLCHKYKHQLSNANYVSLLQLTSSTDV